MHTLVDYGVNRLGLIICTLGLILTFALLTIAPGIAQADLSLMVTKTADLAQVAPGDSLTYTITIENTGTETATDVNMLDNLSQDLNFVSVEPIANCTTGSMIVCSFPLIASGDIETVIIEVNVTTDPISGLPFTDDPETDELTATTATNEDGSERPIVGSDGEVVTFEVSNTAIVMADGMEQEVSSEVTTLVTVSDGPTETALPEGTCGGQVVEGEDAELNGFVIVNAGAGTNGSVIEVPNGMGDSNSDPGPQTATFCFTAPEAGEYILEGNIQALTSSDNSFWVTVDGEIYLWDMPVATGYVIDEVSNRGVPGPVILTLDVGQVEVVVAVREDGARLDRLALARLIPNEVPVASLPPTTTFADTDNVPGEIVTLDGTASADSDGSIVGYNWTINGSATFTTDTATTKVALSDGINTIGLTVTDDGGATAEAVTQTLIVQPPGASDDCGVLLVEAEDASLDGFVVISSGAGTNGEAIEVPNGIGDANDIPGVHTASFCFTVPQTGNYTLEGNILASTDSDNSFWVTIDGENYLWDMEVDASYVIDEVSNRGGPDPVVLNLEAGQLEVVVALREDGAKLDRLELVGQNVVIPNQIPVAQLPDVTNVIDSDELDGENVTLDGSASFDNDGTIAVYNWTVNGTELDEQTRTTSVTLNDGLNTISLTVTDNDGATSSSVTQLITVGAPGAATCEQIVEAETGILTGNFQIGSDVNASNGQYVHVPNGTLSWVSEGNPHTATYCFGIVEAGTYVLNAVVYADTVSNDSFYVEIEGQTYLWDLNVAGVYVNDAVANRNGADPVLLELPVGDVEVIVYQREDGARIDTLAMVQVDSNTLTPLNFDFSQTVANQTPIANPGLPLLSLDTDGLPGEKVTLDSTQSYDLDGYLIDYIWLVNGEVIAEMMPTVFLQDGPNSIELIVIDNNGVQSVMTPITIFVERPSQAGPLLPVLPEVEVSPPPPLP